jgi:hypothetical protein
MFSVVRETVPDDALLRTYRGAVKPERWGIYADCLPLPSIAKSTCQISFLLSIPILYSQVLLLRPREARKA